MTNIKPLLFKIMELSTNKFYDDLKNNSRMIMDIIVKKIFFSNMFKRWIRNCKKKLMLAKRVV